jgi:hypothetical protein
MMKFRNDAEKAAWIAWTHDAARIIAHAPVAEDVATASWAALHADAMLEAMRKREKEKPASAIAGPCPICGTDLERANYPVQAKDGAWACSLQHAREHDAREHEEKPA